MEIFEKYRDVMDKIDEIHNHSPNIFKILKQEQYENRHSIFLSWLFDKRAQHGLKSAFADRFFKACFRENCGIDCSTIRSVRTEVRTNGEEQKSTGKDKKRIDILIEGDNFTCTIENKYGSTVHDNQCQNYRDYIEKKYNGKKNYFVFLDIYKPDDFDEKHDELYADYKFIDYKRIKEILEGLLDTMPDNSLGKTYIKDYIEVLGENYSPNEKYLEQYKKIETEDFDEILSYYGNEKKSSELTEGENLFVSIFKQCYDYYKQSNDSRIRNILNDIVREDRQKKLINTRYQEGWNYAYALNTEFLFQANAAFMRTVDYTARGALSIDIHVGLKPKFSSNFVSYISSHPSFWDGLKYLVDKGWKCNLSYRLCIPTNIMSRKGQYFADILCNISENSSYGQFITNDVVVWNDGETQDPIRKKIARVTACIDNLVSCRQITADEAKAVKAQINQKCEKGIVAGWCLKLSYPLGYDRVTNENKAEVEKLYREKTVEGLNLFGFGDRYARENFS